MKNINLVIADDEYFIRARLAKIIEEKRENINIISLCEDGKDIIKLLSLSNADILLMDIKMIEVDGLEVAKYIYDNKINTKIILISGYNEFNYAVEAMRYGVFDYLTKPISEDELLSSVDKCIEGIKLSKSTSGDNNINHLSILFTAKKDFMGSKDISIIRPTVTKFMNNSDREGYELFIRGQTEDIINNYNATTLYKFIREIINTLDIKYHILQDLTLSQYMQENIFNKNIKKNEDINRILIETGFECMGLNTISTTEQLIGKRILEDIEAHFCEFDYSVSKIATNLDKNPSYINTVFKKVYGNTIKQTVSDYRLEKARELLKPGNLKILDVANQCGYTDIFYFSKRYKSKFGYPPSSEPLKS